MPVRVVEAAPHATAVVALTTTWAEFPAVWASLLDEVYAVVRARLELAPEQGRGPVWRNVMLYKDDAPSVEVGVLVSMPFAPAGRVVPSELPGGSIVTATHRGDYAQLGRTHDAVHCFAAEHGLELAGPRWEIYGHWPEDGSEPETDVCYLVA